LIDIPDDCKSKVVLMKHGWWKSVAVLCLILQVCFLAAGLLHFVISRHCDHRHDDGHEHACPNFPHVHLASPGETGDECDVQPYGHHERTGKAVESAGANYLPRWSTPANVVPCPAEHCLICSLSDLVRSSDVESADEPLLNIFFVRRSADALRFHDLQGVFRPCLPRGPPIVS